MASLSELTVQVLTARLAKRDMSLEELQNEMITISNMIKNLDEGTLNAPTADTPQEEPKQKINFKQIFKKDEVICLICNKGFKTLKRHLNMAHGLKPGEYKKQFNIPAKYTLIASAYSAERKKVALEKGLGEGLVKYRSDKAAKVAAPVVKAKAAKVKKAAPVVKVAPKKVVKAVKTPVAVKVAKKK